MKLNNSAENMRQQYLQLHEKMPQSIFAVPSYSQIFECHFIIYRLEEDHYRNGFYYGKLLFAPNHAESHPDLVFLTPNGRFEIGKKFR